MLYFSGSERVMDDNKIIVSKTDPTGRIAYASSYFLEISDFTLDDENGGEKVDHGSGGIVLLRAA